MLMCSMLKYSGCECATRCSLRCICSHFQCFLTFSGLPVIEGADDLWGKKKGLGINSSWVCKLMRCIRGTVKEECSLPPMDAVWYRVRMVSCERAKRWQMPENENEDNLKLNQGKRKMK